MDKKEIMSVWAAFQQVQEKKKAKLDPVGKEDGDVDNDGDEDSSDEYLANRRKKVGAAVKKEGKIPPQFAKKGEKDDDDEESDEKSEKPKKGENPFAKKEVEEGKLPPALQKAIDKKKGKKVDDEDDKEDKQVDEGNAQCPKCEGKGTVNGKTCTHCDGKGYHMKEGVEQLDELSPELKQRAAASATKKADFHKKMDGKRTATANRIVNKHGDDSRHSEASPKAKASLNKNNQKSGDHYDQQRKRSAQAQKFSSSAKKEGFDLFSEAELDALAEKMKQPGDTGGKGEEFMSTSSPKEKKVMADHEAGSEKKYEDWEETSEKDGSKAGRAVKSQSPVRRGESRKSEPMGKVKGS